MLFLRKLFKLPGPKELGRSDYDALPSRDFTPDCEGYTWEDWHKEVKEKYPIKYFFVETASDFIRFNIWLPIYRPIDDARYWIVSHIIPSRRYHMLDLRQPKNEFGVDVYRYGWRDVPEKMLYAMFNLLDQFVKHELPSYYCPPEEDIDNKNQRDAYFEILAIHKWWFHDKKVEEQAINDLRTKWFRLRKTKSKQSEEFWKQMHEREAELERKTDEMIDRLMKIRRDLWT